MEYSVMLGVHVWMDPDRETQAQLAHYQRPPTKDDLNVPPPEAKNVVLVPKAVIAALQAAQLLPVD
jgi:hypothetical protein